MLKNGRTYDLELGKGELNFEPMATDDGNFQPTRNPKEQPAFKSLRQVFATAFQSLGRTPNSLKSRNLTIKSLFSLKHFVFGFPHCCLNIFRDHTP